MNKIIFCQFSNKLLNPDSNTVADKYYNQVWESKEKDGYWKNEHFWEIPLWIAEISGSLKDTPIRKELYIIDNIKDAIKYLSLRRNNPFNVRIAFSVLDVNKHYVKEIMESLPHRFFIGGYVDFSYFNGLNNFIVFNSVKQFIEYLDLPYEYNLDYSLFAGYNTIPRLTLSYGCLNRCKFCTVEKTINEVSEENILKQIMAFKDLNFKLVYLNDKTFGQTKNYKTLPLLYDIIKEYNPYFQGFVVQTTVMTIIDNNFKELLKSKVIFAIELGIETFNNNLLYKLNKPQNEDIIISAINILIYYNIKIIPNIIIGILNENKFSYNKTLHFLREYKHSIYFLNIYNLAIYQDTQLSREIKTLNENDLNENITDKSFYTEQQKIDNEYFYDKIFNLGLKILNMA